MRDRHTSLQLVVLFFVLFCWRNPAKRTFQGISIDKKTPDNELWKIISELELYTAFCSRWHWKYGKSIPHSLAFIPVIVLLWIRYIGLYICLSLSWFICLSFGLSRFLSLCQFVCLDCSYFSYLKMSYTFLCISVHLNLTFHFCTSFQIQFKNWM